METQLQDKQTTVDADFVFTMRILRSVFQLNVGKQLLVDVPNSALSASLMKAKLCAIGAIDELTLEAYQEVELHGKDDKVLGWLVRKPDESKSHDVARLLDMLQRIGNEEGTEEYDEFLGIVIDSIHSVLYAQENRKKIWFGKYKALFKLFSDELRADVNKQEGQLFFKSGKIWLRSSQPELPVKISNGE